MYGSLFYKNDIECLHGIITQIFDQAKLYKLLILIYPSEHYIYQDRPMITPLR